MITPWSQFLREKARPKTELVTIARDRVGEIDAWIAYHRTIGFSRISVYDNGSRDGTTERLAAWVSKGWFCARHWPLGENPPSAKHVMADAVRQGRAPWILFLLPREYLVLHRHDHVGDWLSEMPPEAGAVALNWHMFEPDGLPAAVPVEEASPFDEQPDRLGRSIVRRDRLREIGNQHSEVSGARVDPDGNPLKGWLATGAPHAHNTTAQINFYWDDGIADLRSDPSSTARACVLDRSAQDMLDRARQANGEVQLPPDLSDFG